MKPIPTLYKPLQSGYRQQEPYKASVERSDSTAVPAASVVCECGGDSGGQWTIRKVPKWFIRRIDRICSGVSRIDNLLIKEPAKIQ